MRGWIAEEKEKGDLRNVCEERRVGDVQAGFAERRRARGRTRKERKAMETNVGLSPQGHIGVKRFLEGELVEVSQREKGLRGSWHPAAVIGVKAGRRVVEYDELLTDDGREKLTENIPVGRCLDGGRLAAARQPWKSPAKRTRALLRPRPPPLPDPSSISWSTGLCVDCYFKDAWWEGVLTEAISSTSRQKRAVVWFPEEEDWELMPLKDMRVGQQWDEDTGSWSLKGCVDVPFSKRGNRSRIMSLGKDSRGFETKHRRRSPDSMELAIALKIDDTGSGRREAEYTSAWNNVDRTLDDADAVISVQLNSPTNTAFTPRLAKSTYAAGTDRSSRDVLKEQKLTPWALRTRSLESFPPRSLNSPRGRSGEESVCGGTSSGEEKDNVGGLSKIVESRKDSGGQGGVMGRGRAVDQKILVDGKATIAMGRSIKDSGNGNVIERATKKVGRVGTSNLLGPVNDEHLKQLIDSGWNVSRTLRKNGSLQWYYRSPNGCLLGSLASALGMCRQMQEDGKNCGVEDENPTLSDMKSPRAKRGSQFSKIRPVKLSKVSRPVGSSIPVSERCQAMVQYEPGSSRQVNGDMVCKFGPLAESNGTVTPSNADSTVVSQTLNLNCKRNAVESDLIAGDAALKRRKIHGGLVQQSEGSGFYSSSPYGGPNEGSMGFSSGPAARKSGLVENRLFESESSFNDGRSNVGGGALETRSKKRACLTEGVKRDQSNELLNTSSLDDRHPFRDGPMSHEPKSKKSRVISNEASCPSEGKSRKSLAILHESSRKKGSTPSKGGASKQAKKGSIHVKKSASHVKKGKKSRTPGRTGVRLEVLLSAPGSSRDLTVGEGDFVRKRTLLSWLIDNGTVSEHQKVRYLHRKDLHCMNEGFVTRDGILCNCCKKIVTLSVFEAHAGSKLHRPSANIFLEDGRSLSVCQVEALAVKTQSETDSQSVFAEQGTIDKSDDTCGICGDGGELICCDHCPSTFHLSCMGLQEVPDGDWYCPNCRCASCGDSQFNGDQTTFNDLTVVLCDQCECEYHVKCLRSRGLELSSIPQDDFFCGESCGRIYQGLRSMVGICKPMEGGFSWTLLRSSADDDRKAGRLSNTEINAEHDSKLSIALSVMQECFRPMIDPRTKIDIITHVLYNRRSDVSRLNYHGFYTMLLERGDELISVATIRVHGARLAELPLIGTRFQYRRQGMCRRLMSAIEEMLQTLGVERLVLPAVPELLDTWTGAFGFQPMDESERLKLMDLNIMAFPGTSILYKRLDEVEPFADNALLPNQFLISFQAVDQSRCAEIVQPGSQKNYPHASLASPPVIGKRGRGRPPKVKREDTNWKDGLMLAVPVATIGAHKLANSGHTESPLASQGVTLKRGRGRPPKNSNALFKPSDGLKLAVSMTVVGAHELDEAECDAGHTCSPTPSGVLGKALHATRDLQDRDHQEELETLPNVIRRKRGRPPRARVNYNNSGALILPTTSTYVQVDQVARFHGGQMQMLSAAREQGMEHAHNYYSERSSNGRFMAIEARGVDEHSDLAALQKTTRSMREVKTPLWLVESSNQEIIPLQSFEPTGEESCRTLSLERHCQNDIPALESSTTGSTKTYERRKCRLSPSSEMEPLSERDPLDYFDEDDLEPVAEPGFSYEAVSVPIRTFPSQFASRGDHNTPPGTFIPVETIVVNSQPKAETLDELLVPECKETLIDASLSERAEQRSGGKLLLRLKLPKRKMSPRATCDLENSQPSPTSIKLPNGGLLPPTFSVSDQISEEVKRFEQFDSDQLKQPDSTMGPHGIPVTVS